MDCQHLSVVFCHCFVLSDVGVLTARFGLTVKKRSCATSVEHPCARFTNSNEKLFLKCHWRLPKSL